MRDIFSLQHRSHKNIRRRLCRGGALLLAAAACGCSSLTLNDSNPVAASELNFNRVELHRHGCISGDCPSYTVSIKGDGSVHYSGDAHVAVRGARDGRADPTALQKLRELLLDNADVYWLKDRYSPGHNHCGAWTMDGAAVTLDIQAPQLHKHINHYLGCHGAPVLLTQIENAIDRAADVQRWTQSQ